MATATITTTVKQTDWMENYRRGELTGIEKCMVCGTETMRPKLIFDPNGSRAVYCKRCIPRVHRLGSVDTAKNSFANFTLDHVRDEGGKKVTVNSIAELRAAEKRYNFALAVASDDGGDTSAPPQHEAWAGDIAHKYEKKFNLDPAAYQAEAARKGVSAGVAAKRSDTLADHPNPV